MNNGRVLLFGGTGFIGGELEKKLIKNNLKFTTLGRSQKQASHNHQHFKSINFFDYESWQGLIHENDTIVFLIPCHMPAKTDEKLTEELYINSFNYLLSVCKNNRIKKFIFMSSGGAVYGDGGVLFNENDIPHPKSAYGKLKLTMEALLLQGEFKNFFLVCIVRPSNVYGESQNPHISFGAVTTFYYKISHGLTIDIFGDLGISKDYLHVDDLVEALIKIIQGNISGVYNLGQGKVYTLKEILDYIEQLLGKKAICKFYPLRDGDIYQYKLDISKAKKDLGFNPKIDLPEGINRYLNLGK